MALYFQRGVKHYVYGKQKAAACHKSVKTCVFEVTCLILLRSYSIYLVNRKELNKITFLRVLAKSKFNLAVFCLP